MEKVILKVDYLGLWWRDFPFPNDTFSSLQKYVPQTEQKCRIAVRVSNWEHEISNEDWRYEIFYLDWLDGEK